jgi:PhoPQ-activated pathogenicity-related protein
MTKAAVRTMDATQMFLSDEGVVIDNFIVSGASKRGWTTWLTAAADERVIGIAPLVYDALNFVPQIKHHFDTYGTFSPAVQDYVDEGIFFPMGNSFVNRFEEPGAGPALTRIVDPYEYRGRFALMPKLLINSTGDQFFVPDSAQLYFNRNISLEIAGFDQPLNIDGLTGERKLAYIENTDHGLNRPQRVVDVFLGWYVAVLEGRALPGFDWEIQRNDPPTTLDSILIDLPAGNTLTRATLWRAVSPVDRDFRFDETGSGTGTPMWRVVSDLTPIDTEIVAELIPDSTAPTRLQAFFVELEFADAITGFPQFFTTEVVITPDELPAIN